MPGSQVECIQLLRKYGLSTEEVEGSSVRASYESNRSSRRPVVVRV